MRNVNNRSCISHDEIIALYKKGTSSVEIGKRAGISATAVLNILDRRGIKKRTAKQIGESLRQYDYEAIAKEYENGSSWDVIIANHGCDVHVISNVLKKLKIQKRGVRKGKNHPQWKATKMQGGYVQEDVNGQKKWKHRTLIEDKIGRCLKVWETVHHIDGQKTHNVLSNLAVMPSREHTRFHSFLRHRKIKPNKKWLRLICRRQSAYYWRFTKKDCEDAWKTYPVEGRSYKTKERKRCMAIGCDNQRNGSMYCSKHIQRKEAISRGHWGYRNGKPIPCLLKKISD